MTASREIAPGIWQAVEPLTAEISLYLHVIAGRDGLVLVDGGLPRSQPTLEALISAASGDVADLVYLLNTHGHHDHIGCFARLAARSGATVVAHPGAVAWLEDLVRNRDEFAFHRPDIIGPTPELLAELAPTYAEPCRVGIGAADGTSIRLGADRTLRAMSLPGHVQAELGWFETSTRTLILGDAITGTSWPLFHGHLLPTAFRSTIHKLRAFAMDGAVELVAMSHHEPLNRWDFLALLDTTEAYLNTVSQTVTNAIRYRAQTLREVWTRVCADMGKIREFRGLAMVEAHLRELVMTGQARVTGPDTYLLTDYGALA